MGPTPAGGWDAKTTLGEVASSAHVPPGLYRMAPLSRKEVEGTKSAGLIPAPQKLRRIAGGSATEKARGMVHFP